jgi:serine O-acetyltransferase
MDRVNRICEKMRATKSERLARLLHCYLRTVYSCDIGRRVIIGEGTVFPHNGLGVVIHPHAVIGKNCRILQNVTIGGRNGDPVVPVLGDRVLVGAGAIILGPVRIGDNAKIGAGAVVVHSVPANAVVVGNPARISRFLNSLELTEP